VTAPRPHLLGLDDAELTQLLQGPGRALMVLKSLAEGHDPRSDPKVPKSLQVKVRARTQHTPLEEISRAEASDGTRKLLLRLHDGHAVECVLIPERDRTTLCVSSQVGCRRGCGFCLTATMGLKRNLEAWEITGQVHAALSRQEGLPPLRNLVFMGMGEPLDNPVAVQAALSVLTNSRGYGFGARHVTVSTVAPSPAAVHRTRDWPGRLALSLHAADDALRRSLIATQRFDTEALVAATLEVCSHRRQPLFVEITLLDGVNDGVHHARQTADLFASTDVEVRFNLLPMNPVAGRPYGASPQAVAEAYAEVLRSHGFFTQLRRARGQDARAACGQLAVLNLAPDPGAAYL